MVPFSEAHYLSSQILVQSLNKKLDINVWIVKMIVFIVVNLSFN